MSLLQFPIGNHGNRQSTITDVAVRRGGGAEKVRSGEAMSEQGGDVGAGGRWGAAELMMAMSAAVLL